MQMIRNSLLFLADKSEQHKKSSHYTIPAQASGSGNIAIFPLLPRLRWNGTGRGGKDWNILILGARVRKFPYYVLQSSKTKVLFNKAERYKSSLV